MAEQPVEMERLAERIASEILGQAAPLPTPRPAAAAPAGGVTVEVSAAGDVRIQIGGAQAQADQPVSVHREGCALACAKSDGHDLSGVQFAPAVEDQLQRILKSTEMSRDQLLSLLWQRTLSHLVGQEAGRFYDEMRCRR